MSTLREALIKSGFEDFMGTEDYHITVDDALSAFRQWLEAEGLVVVPKISTYRMDDAAVKGLHDICDDFAFRDAEVVWRSMIAAAPDALAGEK